MRPFLLFELLKGLKQKPNLLRKVKILAIIGISVFLIAGGLTVWASITAFNYVSTTAIQFPFKAEIEQLPRIQALSCWNKAQSLLAIQPWLEKPALDHVADLKTACLEYKAKISPNNTTERISL